MSLSEYPVNNAFGLRTGKALSSAPTAAAGEKSSTSYWYHVQLSQFNETFFSNLVQSGVNLTNNTIEIRFNTPELSELTDILPQGDTDSEEATAATYRLHVNVNYQAAILTAKGAASTTFVPPIPVLSSTLSF